MKKLDSSDMDIALIGYTQAGKTTLAVGLFATSTEDFTVSGKGEDTDIYLRDRKAALESGRWLEATTENQMPDLCLTINRVGKPPVDLHFKEYMGERACNIESYKRDVVGNPRAVVILLNPCMAILRDAVQRNGMICQLKEIISYLAEPGMRCEYIAFVITASDLLSTSLRDFCEEFDFYKSEITNFLNTSVFRENWKEFAVTVSGELEDPTRPRLARGTANSSREPFIWLIQSLEAADAKSKMTRLLKYTSIVTSTILLLCSTLGSLWYFWIDREAEREVIAILQAGGPAVDEALNNGKQGKINAALTQIEKSRKNRVARSPFFEENKRRFTQVDLKLAEKIEQGRIFWFPIFFAERKNELIKRIDDVKGLSPDKCRKTLDEIGELGERFAEFQPVCDSSQEGFTQLKKLWNDVRLDTSTILERGCEKYFASRLSFYSDVAKTNATEEMCQQWRREISSWDPVTSDGKEVREKILEVFDGNLKSWRTAYESWVFDEGCNALMEKLRFVSRISDETATEFHKAMVECRQYEKWAEDEDASELVDWNTRKRVWNDKIRPTRQRALDALREDETRRLDPEAQDCPVLSENTRNELDQILKDEGALSVADYETWMKELAQGVAGRQEEWRQVQRRRCESFIEDIKADNLEGPDVLRAFQNFYSDNPNNPSLSLAVEGVHKRIGVAFRQLYNEVYFEYSQQSKGMNQGDIMVHVETGIRRLRELCRALGRVRYEPLKNSCWFKLAKRCQEEGRLDQGLTGCFPQKLTITKVDARMHYSQFDSDFKNMSLSVDLGVKTWNSSTYSDGQCASCGQTIFLQHDNLDWKTVFSGYKEFDVNPFANACISVTATDYNGGFFSSPESSSSRFFFYTMRNKGVGGSGPNLKWDQAQGCFTGEMTLCINRTWENGDKRPTIAFRIYVTASGEDLRDWWPSVEDQKFKVEAK
ncbi:MAG: hypothetical protein Q4G65_05385 [bacterium]|nr:hypothetical protein [bacterium]